MTLPSPILPLPAHRHWRKSSNLLFGFRGQDLSLTSYSGHVLSLTRSTVGTYRDGAGKLCTAGKHQPRWNCLDLDGDGIFETVGLLIEGQRQNICLRSSALNTAPWTQVGTGVVGGSTVFGGHTMWVVTDNDAANVEYIYQNISFTANASKVFAVAIKRHPASGTTGPRIGLLDNTAVLYRVVGAVTWTGSTGKFPSVAIAGGAGSYLGYLAYADDVYVLFFYVPGIVAANANVLELVPAYTNGAVSDTGNCYFGSVMVENAAFPSVSYIDTGAAAVTRNADDILTTFGWSLRDITAYARFSVGPSIPATFSSVPPTVFELSDVGDNNEDLMYVSGINIMAAISGASLSQAGQATALVTLDQIIEANAQYKDHTTAPACAISVNNAAQTAFGVGDPLFNAYTNANLRIGKSTAAGADGYLYATLLDLKIAAALRSTLQMQSAY